MLPSGVARQEAWQTSQRPRACAHECGRCIAAPWRMALTRNMVMSIHTGSWRPWSVISRARWAAQRARRVGFFVDRASPRRRRRSSSRPGRSCWGGAPSSSGGRAWRRSASAIGVSESGEDLRLAPSELWASLTAPEGDGAPRGVADAQHGAQLVVEAHRSEEAAIAGALVGVGHRSTRRRRRARRHGQVAEEVDVVDEQLMLPVGRAKRLLIPSRSSMRTGDVGKPVPGSVPTMRPRRTAPVVASVTRLWRRRRRPLCPSCLLDQVLTVAT